MNSHINAWVESPLQLLGALEHAALACVGGSGSTMTIVPRGGDAQLERTAGHLAERVRSDSTVDATIALDMRIIPRSRFTAPSHWLIGDAFSGQFQARLDRVTPDALTIVDDGAITKLLAQNLAAHTPMLRPRAPRLFAGMRRDLATRTTRHLRGLADAGCLFVTTYLSADDEAVARLRSVGAVVTTHHFDVTRRWGARATGVPRDALIVLGSARVADGLADAGAELNRIFELARRGPIAYLPHRREPDWFVTAVARLPRTAVVEARLPIELALGGTERALTVVTEPSTAAETLPIVLRGSGSTVNSPLRVREEAS